MVNYIYITMVNYSSILIYVAKLTVSDQHEGCNSVDNGFNGDLAWEPWEIGAPTWVVLGPVTLTGKHTKSIKSELENHNL